MITCIYINISLNFIRRLALSPACSRRLNQWPPRRGLWIHEKHASTFLPSTGPAFVFRQQCISKSASAAAAQRSNSERFEKHPEDYDAEENRHTSAKTLRRRRQIQRPKPLSQEPPRRTPSRRATGPQRKIRTPWFLRPLEKGGNPYFSRRITSPWPTS
jgi:hypothetical protein